MSRFLTVILALGLLSGITVAHAEGDRHDRPCCGPVATTRYTRTIHPSLYVTRYRDRSVTDHVTRVRHVVDVTRIQPIIQVHEVTRVHHVTVVSVREAYATPMPQWNPVPYMQPGAGYGCSCGDE